MLLPLALLYRQLGPVDWKRNWPYLLGMVLTSTLVWGPLYYAILRAGVGISLAINYASIVIGMFLFGWLFAREKFTRDKLLSTVLGLVGLWLIFAPSVAGLGWLALGAALVSGLSSAANSIFAKKVPYNATQTTIMVWIGSVVANVPMAFILGEHAPAVGWHIEWLHVAFFAVASVVSSWLFVKGLKLIEAGAAGILGLLEIVFGVLFGVLLFSESIDRLAIFGMAGIIAAAAIPYLKDFNLQKGKLE
jgi:drug/metabolite transporter (DMT)-like permease